MDESHNKQDISGGAPTSAPLRGGFQYENLVALLLCVKLFEKGASENHLFLETRSKLPFDDVEIESNQLKTIAQIKRNAPGSIKNLVKSLQKKESKKAKIYSTANQEGYERAIITYLSHLPEALAKERWMDWDCVRLSKAAVCDLGLDERFEGVLLVQLPSAVEIRAQLSNWFGKQHRSLSERILDSAIQEIDGIFQSTDEERRKIGIQRAIALLQLKWRTIKHNVHNPAELIDRPSVFNKVLNELTDKSRIILLGEPGIGKSAILDQLVCYLNDKSLRVVRYSCFISPEDTFVADRLTVKYLVRELAESESVLVSCHEHVMSVSEVIESLRNAGDDIYILIDGLDHVKRKQGEQALLEFGNVLASIAAQAKVKLLVSVQSIDQLPDQLRAFDMTKVCVPTMTYEEISDLLAHFMGTEKGSVYQDDLFVQKLRDYSSGNPLLLSYLIRKTINALSNRDYSEFSRQLGSVTFSNVKNYLKTLMIGLEPGSKYLLRVLCELRFGFDQSFYDEIGNEMGCSKITVKNLWSQIAHVFKRTAPRRYLVWHYSLEEMLEEDGVYLDSGVRDIRAALAKMGDSMDKSLYQPWFELQNENCDPVSIVRALKKDAIRASIRAKEALEISLQATRLAGLRNGFASLIEAGFSTHTITRLLYHDDDASKGEEAIAFSKSRLRNSSVLYEGNGSRLLGLLSRIGSFGRLLCGSEELSWLTDTSNLTRSTHLAFELAVRILSGQHTFERAILVIGNARWKFREDYERTERYATLDENVHINLEIAYDLGRILAYNINAEVLCDESSDITFAELEDGICYLNELLIGASEVYVSRGFQQSAIRCARAVMKTTGPLTIDGLYILALFGDEEAKARVNSELSAVDIKGVVESAVSHIRFHNDRTNKPLRELIALSCAARDSKSSLSWSIIESSLKALEHSIERNSALLDVLDYVSMSGSAWRTTITELERTFDCARRKYERYRIDYAPRASEVLMESLRLGAMPVSNFEDLNRLCALNQRGVVLAEIEITAGRCDLPGFIGALPNIEATRNFGVITRPDEWQEEAGKLGALYLIQGRSDEAERLALEAYRLRNRYGYHKDYHYYWLIETLRTSSTYLDWKRILPHLMKVGAYLPAIDFVTDGDETRDWFHSLLGFIREPTFPSTSLLFNYAKDRIVNGPNEDDWLWRSQPLFHSMFNYSSQEVSLEWLKVIRSWVYEGIPNPEGRFRWDRGFNKWVAKSVRSDAIWSCTEEAEIIKQALMKWGGEILEIYADRIAQAQAAENSDFRIFYGPMIREIELMLGREASFPPQDEFDSPREAEPLELLAAEALVAERISETMMRVRFWLSSYYGCKSEQRRQILDALKSFDTDGAEIALRAFTNNLSESGTFEVATMPQLSQVLGELGLVSELEALVELMSDEFCELFPLSHPDKEFSLALANAKPQ